MKRLVYPALVLCLLILFVPLPAKESQPPQFKTIVVDRFVNANGAKQSPAFIQAFCDGMRDGFVKLKMAGQVIEQDAKPAEADAAASLVIEGKFTSLAKGGFMAPGKLGVEIDIYRASDHALVKTMTPTIPFKPTPLNTDKGLGGWTGTQGARLVQKELKGVSLDGIPAASTPQTK